MPPPPGATAVPAHARSFGKYTLIAKLATGGMAEIFYARLTGVAGFEKPVVIKRILPHYADDEQFVDMFLDEARIAARISHPNVCQTYELGQVDGQYFIAMEYLEGVTFSNVMRKVSRDRRGQDLRLFAGLLIQACEGLHHAHELRDPDGQPAGVVHRDVSPQNLFVTTDGVLKVLDFGIAKAQGASSKTRTGTVKGKYAYMSPEQLRGEVLDRRADVFSLGICLHEAITGRRLFFRDTDFLIFKAITEEPIPRVSESRPDVPPALTEVVATALARQREARFPSARALGEAISRAVESLGGPLLPISIAAEMQRTFGEEIRAHREKIAQASALVPPAPTPAPTPAIVAGVAIVPPPSGRAPRDDADPTIPIPVPLAPPAHARAFGPADVTEPSQDRLHRASPPLGLDLEDRKTRHVPDKELKQVALASMLPLPPPPEESDEEALRMGGGRLPRPVPNAPAPRPDPDPLTTTGDTTERGVDTGAGTEPGDPRGVDVDLQDTVETPVLDPALPSPRGSGPESVWPKVAAPMGGRVAAAAPVRPEAPEGAAATSSPILPTAEVVLAPRRSWLNLVIVLAGLSGAVGLFVYVTRLGDGPGTEDRAGAARSEAAEAEVVKAEATAEKAEGPEAEGSEVEAPKAEDPEAEGSEVEAPKVEGPEGEFARSKAEKTEAPTAEAADHAAAPGAALVGGAYAGTDESASGAAAMVSSPTAPSRTAPSPTTNDAKGDPPRTGATAAAKATTAAPKTAAPKDGTALPKDATAPSKDATALPKDATAPSKNATVPSRPGSSSRGGTPRPKAGIAATSAESEPEPPAGERRGISPKDRNADPDRDGLSNDDESRRPGTSRRATAVATAEPGYFSIDSQPYAVIFIDGKNIGETPIYRHELPPGTHTVKAVSQGKTKTFRITIEPGKDAPPRRLKWDGE